TLRSTSTALLAPMFSHRARDQRWLIAATVTVSAVGLAGVWFAPLAGAPAWTLLFGLGQGAALGLAIYFTAARAPDPVTSASLSAFTQGGGYLVATAGPLLVGLLHAVTGTWTVAVLAMLVVIVFEGAVGWQAGRARTRPRRVRPAGGVHAAGRVPGGHGRAAPGRLAARGDRDLDRGRNGNAGRDRLRGRRRLAGRPRPHPARRVPRVATGVTHA